MTRQPRYLQRAQSIFEDLVNRSWSEQSCGGGCCWQARGTNGDVNDMTHCYKNAITSELFFSLSAQLMATYRTQGDDSRAMWAMAWAEKALRWFARSGMLNSSSLVNDGLDTFAQHPNICLNNRRTAYTYNQGVLLSGLGYLYAATHMEQRPVVPVLPTAERDEVAPTDGTDEEGSQALPGGRVALLKLAVKMIAAVWADNSTLTYRGSGGVLREVNEPDLGPDGTLPNLYTGSPGTDGLQFKSVLLRHLRYLIDQVMEASGGSEAAAQKAVASAGGNLSTWREHIVRNGISIWDHAACASPQRLTPGKAALSIPALFGFLWTGPCSWAFGGPTATTQTAALDVFVAAVGL